MAKQKFRITNWKTYNDALRQRGSLTVWLSDDATAAWYDVAEPERRGRPLRYTDTAITTAMMLKSVLGLTLRALQGFIDSVFQ
ncbi:MAG: IS5/IS1182 family transposase, partial [Candidatus Symbiopectobacterium sp. Dall1.0]|nr:IS5/IS1182 family transposase [Candidatus Symbiopectobacterium sp. Dall1.0]